ncbi:hypothetical protein HZS_8087 [Henneguya salminicola]|nr:hypothetical protein HZS_8087 [Henneguya salminicola]
MFMVVFNDRLEQTVLPIIQQHIAPIGIINSGRSTTKEEELERLRLAEFIYKPRRGSGAFMSFLKDIKNYQFAAFLIDKKIAYCFHFKMILEIDNKWLKFT